MSFHNAVNGTSILLEGTPDAELCSHLNSAASVLLGKTKVLRRQRLPLIFDLYAWVTFQGALTHMMITIPYWLRFTGLQTPPTCCSRCMLLKHHLMLFMC
jgi:hypothetical protein